MRCIVVLQLFCAGHALDAAPATSASSAAGPLIVQATALDSLSNAKKFLNLNAKFFAVSGRDYLPYLRALNRSGKWEEAVATLHEMLDMNKQLEVLAVGSKLVF